MSRILKHTIKRTTSNHANNNERADCTKDAITFPIILNLDVDTNLLKSLHNIESRDLNTMSEPTYGKARGSDYNFFKNHKDETRKLENELLTLVKTASKRTFISINPFTLS